MGLKWRFGVFGGGFWGENWGFGGLLEAIAEPHRRCGMGGGERGFWGEKWGY